MFDEMLAKSEAILTDYKKEKVFLTGNIIYLSIALRECNSDPEIIESAINEIVNYLSEVLECVCSEWEIMDAVNRYLYSLCNDICAFHGFENSPEFPLFKGIFELFAQTYAKRVKEYIWYLSVYKNYVVTNRIGKSYKIISKQEHLSQERYAGLLKTIPKVEKNT